MTCSNKDDVVKMAKRWCRGSKNSKYQKPCLGGKTCYEKICSRFILKTYSINPFVCDLALMVSSAP